MAAREATKYDPNTEIFQMRAQWKKIENCRKQWYERWSWLQDEQRDLIRELKELKQEVGGTLPRESKEEHALSLKPVPTTSAGVVGWLSSRPECQLEVHTEWRALLPGPRLPDAWEDKNFVGQNS